MRQEIPIPGGILVTENPRVRLVLKAQPKLKDRKVAKEIKEGSAVNSLTRSKT